MTYANNPLAEVICQVRWARISDFNDSAIPALRPILNNLEYVSLREDIKFSIDINPQSNEGALAPKFESYKTFNFVTSDDTWCATLCSDYLALTCTKYTSWEDFQARFLALIDAILPIKRDFTFERLSLSYKDVIEREAVGLSGAPWSDLVSPFLLGPLSLGSFEDGVSGSENDVSEFLTSATIKLDSSMLLLRSSLLTSIDGSKKAFLIDAEFFYDKNLEIDLLSNRDTLLSRLKTLHENAGALFRRSITERLHDALRPRPVDA